MSLIAIRNGLARPFPVNRIHWRVGATTKDKAKCIPLAYIDARDVMQRLDDVLGPECWQVRYSHVADGLVICELGLQIAGEWIWKANGAGDTQVEAEKGKLSDAFKRAAVLWGIGRYLYGLPDKWVDLNNGKFTPPELPEWATPKGYDEIMEKRKVA
jgi:hypothetical protein